VTQNTSSVIADEPRDVPSQKKSCQPLNNCMKNGATENARLENAGQNVFDY